MKLVTRFLTTLVVTAVVSAPAIADQTTKPPPKSAAQLEEVVVQGNCTKPATTEIDPQTRRLFKVAGSLDPLASLYALPGVINGGDFRSAPAVRGSAAEDNAYPVAAVIFLSVN